MGTETWIISLPLSDSILYLKIIHPPNFREEPFISNVTFGEALLRRTPKTPSCRVFHKIYFDMEKIYSD